MPEDQTKTEQLLSVIVERLGSKTPGQVAVEGYNAYLGQLNNGWLATVRQLHVSLALAKEDAQLWPQVAHRLKREFVELATMMEEVTGAIPHS